MNEGLTGLERQNFPFWVHYPFKANLLINIDDALWVSALISAYMW